MQILHGRPLLRRLTAWAMLALQCLVASGLPLPLAIPPDPGSAAGRKLAAKDRSRPFPCMDKACGCDSAERCFTNCCCHTPAETLRWAKARGIEPAVIVALSRRMAVAEPEPAAGNCCASTASKPACCETAEPQQPSCCAVAEAEAGLDDEPAPGGAPAPKVVSLRAMLACGGIIDGLLSLMVAGSLPPPAVVFSPQVVTGGSLICGDERPQGTPAEPAEPPPRQG